nr:receptor-like serine/threonine-protein kinase sd1-7 [Quercus suber]
MARIFKQNELEANTNRIVGTYGYMSPERNNSFNQSDLVLNLVGYAWALWREDKGLDLVDPTISASFVANQVLRCIHVSLLCVEEGAVDRPTMSDMLSMLTNESTQLPLPKKPAFSNGRKPVGATIPKKESEVHTVWSNREMKSNSQLIEK